MANIKIQRKLFTAKKGETLSIRVGQDFKDASKRVLTRYNRKSLQELILDVYEQWLLEELSEDEIVDIQKSYENEHIRSDKKSAKKAQKQP